MEAEQHDPGPAGREPSDRTTVVEVLSAYRAGGFGADFFAEADATVRCGTCGAVTEARRFARLSVRRLEGASDPADMQAIVATRCPVCDARGTLVLGFGPSASDVDGDVLTGMQEGRGEGVLPEGVAPHEADLPGDDRPAGSGRW